MNRTKKKIFYLFTSLIVLLFLSGCNIENEPEKLYEYKYKVPDQIDDGWQTASLENVGMDETNLGIMMDKINNDAKHRIHNILIVKNGKLVFEEYFKGYKYSNNPPGSNGDFIQYDRDVEHYFASVTKSVTSALIGIAIKEGFIKSVEDKIIDYFSEYSEFMTGEKKNISIKHLLTMSSGLPFDESTYPYGDPKNDITQLFNNSDPIKWVLEQELDFTPGTTFHYNSGTTNVLGALVENTSNMDLVDFMEEYLFNPIGIYNEDYIIEVFKSGRYFMSGGLYMSSRELLKIGSIYLNEGKWNDHNILSKNYILESQENSFDPPGYGYQWWTRKFNVNGVSYSCYYAAGWGGQYMFVFPEKNLLIQIFSGYFVESITIDPFDLVGNYILKSLSN